MYMRWIAWFWIALAVLLVVVNMTLGYETNPTINTAFICLVMAHISLVGWLVQKDLTSKK